MNRYVILYHAPIDISILMENTSAAEVEKDAEEWYAWADKCGDRLIDMGTVLRSGGSISEENSRSSQGNLLCGYSILEVDDIDDAISLLEIHPHPGCNEARSIKMKSILPLSETPKPQHN